MAQLIASESGGASGGASTGEAGFRGPEAGVVKVRMPELYFTNVLW